MSTKFPEARVAVVIPFYQSSRGLLRRAVESIHAQRYQPRPLIIVVDDASPVAATDELAGIADEERGSLMILRQENAGPGAARNRGLDAVPEDVVFVAFLDSDDRWLPGHLMRAVTALESGHDFYFSNYFEIGSREGAFETRGVLDLASHEPIGGTSGSYAFKGDIRSAILSHCPIEASTVVLRRTAFKGIRFREKFRNAAEDHMFWFEALSRSARAAFSPEVGCEYGSGVNIFRAIQPGSDTAVRALVDKGSFYSNVRSSYDLSPRQRAIVRRRMQEVRSSLAYVLLHRVRRRRSILWAEVLRLLTADPAAILLLPWEMLQCTTRWLASRGAER